MMNMDSNMEPSGEMNTMLSDMAAEMATWQHAAGGSLPEVAAGWLAPHYLQSVRGQIAALPAGPERFKLLRLAVADAAVLQRGGHSGDWLQLERERLEFHRQKYRDALAAAQAKIQKLRDPKLPLSDADRQAIVAKADEILGGCPKPRAQSPKPSKNLSGYIRPNKKIKKYEKPPRGKIGRLPEAVQEQINRWLEKGEKARTLVVWLSRTNKVLFSLPHQPLVC